MSGESGTPWDWFDELAREQAQQARATRGPSAPPSGPWRTEEGPGGPGPKPSPRSPGLISKIAGKVGWNITDQVLSSLTNAVLAVLVAQNSTKQGNGAFAAVFLLFSLLIAIERALAGQVLSIRHSASSPEVMRRAAGQALGAVSVLSVPAGLLLAAAGLAIGGELRLPLIMLGLTITALLFQDTCRMVFFAQSRANLAALNDGLWAVVQFTVMGVLIAGGWAANWNLILVWGLSAGVGVVLALVQLRVVPRPQEAPDWIRAHRDLLGYLLPETLITSGGDKVAFLAIGKIVNLSAIGAVNVARQLLNPLLIISQAATSFAMPEISRRTGLSPKARRLVGLGLGGVMAAISLAYVGIVLLLPDVAGEWLFGDSWAGARAVLLPMGLFSTTAGFCLGPFVVIAAMGHAKRTFRVTVLQTVLVIILMPAGAVLAGTEGAAWGLVIGKLIEVPFWVITLMQVSALGPVLRPEDDGAAEGSRR